MRCDESGGRVDEVVFCCEDLEGGDLEGQVLLSVGIMEGGIGDARKRVLELQGDWMWVEYRICVEVFLVICVGRCAIRRLDGILRCHDMRLLSMLHRVYLRIQIRIDLPHLSIFLII